MYYGVFDVLIKILENLSMSNPIIWNQILLFMSFPTSPRTFKMEEEWDRFDYFKIGSLMKRFYASLNHKNAGQTKFIKTELTKIRYKSSNV